MSSTNARSYSPEILGRLAVICDSVPEIVYWSRRDGYCQYLNRAFYAYTGMAVGSAEGSGWEPIMHAADREPNWTRWLESTSTGSPYEFCYRLLRDDRNYRWFLGRCYPLRMQGEIALWVGISSDIENLVATERAKEGDWHASDDPRAITDYGGAIFEVIDPAGQRFETLLRSDGKIAEPPGFSTAPSNDPLGWRIRKLASFPFNRILANEQRLRVDRLASLFNGVLSAGDSDRTIGKERSSDAPDGDHTRPGSGSGR